MEKDIGTLLLIAVAGYLLGSFPTAYLLVKRFARKNILEWGTANVGTLNVYRATNSKTLTVANLAGDFLKGALAMVVGFNVAKATGLEPDVGVATGGILAVLGHNYTVFLRFRGGKGLATSFPVLLYLAPLLVILWIVTFLASVAATRLLVVGQILGTVAMPIGCYILFPDVVVPVSILSLVVFIRHAPRIPAIVNGTEPKLYYKIDNSPKA